LSDRRTLLVTLRGGGPPWPVDVELRAGDSLPIAASGELDVDREALLAATDPHEHGVILGKALFRDAVRDLFVQAAVRRSTPLHVQLAVAAEALRDLAWETLCAPLDGAWRELGLDQRVAFSRSVPSAADRDLPILQPRDLRALAVIAEPRGLDKFKLGPVDAPAALAALRRGLGDVPLDLLGDVPGALGPASLDELCATLTAGRYTLLHIVAHGRHGRSGESALFLADADGAVDTVTQTALAARLKNLTHGLPHLVFCAACESGSDTPGAPGLARHLVSEVGLPALVAMQRPVSVATAHAFSAAFYARLRVHGHVDQAAVEALAGLAGRRDALVPAVYTRLGARPLFAAARRPRAPVIAAAAASVVAAISLAVALTRAPPDDPPAEPAIVAPPAPAPTPDHAAKSAEPAAVIPPIASDADPQNPAIASPTTPDPPATPTAKKPDPPATASKPNRPATCSYRGACSPDLQRVVRAQLGKHLVTRVRVAVDCEGALEYEGLPADGDAGEAAATLARRKFSKLSRSSSSAGLLDPARLPCTFKFDPNAP
jgi:hypothetical protein